MVETKQYFFMHKDVVVGTVLLNKHTGTLVDYCIEDFEHAPFGCRNAKTFYSWWERRATPKHQIGNVLISEDTNLSYMMKNLSLSMTDTYWILPEDLSLSWKDVNLYSNFFFEDDFSFEQVRDDFPFKPSSTTQGELWKRWIVKGKERYLVKGNHGAMCRESINEVFATEVHERQGKSHVHYELFDLPPEAGSKVGCISKNFTDASMEFIPAYDITFYDKKPSDQSELENYIRVCVKLGINEIVMRDFMDYMILSDFCITNTDRHLLNFGVLRNPDTLEFVAPAPIFDSGNSMFYSENYDPHTVLDIKVNSFYRTERKMLDHVSNFEVLDLNKLPDENFIVDLYNEDPYSRVYGENMKSGYARKIELIDALQHGRSINPRSTFFFDKM